MSYVKQNQDARGRRGKIPTAGPIPVTLEAGPGFVTAVIHVGPNTIGLKFESPEQLLEFFTGLMEHAVIAWPDNEFIKMYVEDD